MVKAIDPYLYEIKIALEETKVNPTILPAVIRAIANIYYGTGHGKVQIFIQDGTVTNINPEEKMKVDIEAVLLEESA